MPLFDLSDRVKLRLRGSDRIRFLNGQVTNDVRKADSHHSMAACVLSARGRLDAFVYINVEAETLLLDAEPELQETLQPRLERYLIADDVTIEEVSAELALFHSAQETPLLPNEFAWRQSQRFGIAGWDLFAPAAEHDRLREILGAKQPFFDPEQTEQFRIEQGIPRWGRELTGEIIPVEANLETDAIDYAKGCYIGQEVISRMKMSGQKNKQLRGLVAGAHGPLADKMHLTSIGEDRREVGRVTSATRSAQLKRDLGLAYVKRGFNETDQELEAFLPSDSSFTHGIRVRVVDLPFA